jgi:hypothetical protein
VGGFLPIDLPADEYPRENGTKHGMLTSNSISRIIEKNKHMIPKPTSIKSYPEQVDAFLKKIKEEYDFYNTKYRSILQKLFSEIQQGSQSTSADLSAAIQQDLQLSLMLNVRLNDMTQIINGITQSMLASSQQMEDKINQFNTTVQDQQQKLENQNRIISSNEATMKIRKEMVKYTEEKARRSDNLLKLYSFLNIIAVGLLVYVYKAADE